MAKWQWRMNEKRNNLQDHEFLIPRPKKTQDMLDLDDRWQGKLKQQSLVLKRGYTINYDKNQKKEIQTKQKIYDHQRAMTDVNTVHIQGISNLAIATF